MEKLSRRNAVRGLAASLIAAASTSAAIASPQPTDEKATIEKLRRRWLAAIEAAKLADDVSEAEYDRVDDGLPTPHPFITRDLNERGPMKIFQEHDLRNINHWGTEADWDERKALRARDTALIKEWMAIRRAALDASKYDALCDEAEAAWDSVYAIEAEIRGLGSVSPHALKLKLDVWVWYQRPKPDELSDAIVLEVIKRLETATA